VHESVHVYRVQGPDPDYLMLFETVQADSLRRYGLARAENLGGPWRRETDSYASGSQLRWSPNAPGWTDEVSHGELIRAGFDDRMEIAPGPVRFLIQGMPAGNHKGDYTALPWWLGLIESTR
jgi:endo-1,4-beta-xylanase